MIDRTYILDHEERTAPPESNVLEVGLTGDVVYLTIGRMSENYSERNYKAHENADIAVPVTDLVNALIVHARANERKRLADAGYDLTPVIPGG